MTGRFQVSATILLTYCPVRVTAEARHGKMMVTSDFVVPVPIVIVSPKPWDVVEGAGARRGAR